MTHVEHKDTARQSLAIFLVMFALGVGLAAYQGFPDGLPSQDAVVHNGIARDLFRGEALGRQGLIGSLRWAPLPTLLVLPWIRLGELVAPGFAACIAAALAGALLCAFLNGWWARHGLRAGLRFAALLALFVSPMMLGDIAAGSSNAVFLLCAVMTVCFVIEWWETDELRPLAYLSVMVGLGIVTRYQFLLAFVAVMLAVFLHLKLKRRGHFYAQATLIIVGLPTLYFAALWLAANWLIMGEPFFFLRGLPWGSLAAVFSADFHSRADVAQRLAAAGRDWGALVHEGCRWEALIMPLAVALAGWAGGRLFGRHRTVASLPCLAAALLMFWGLPWLPRHTAERPMREAVEAVWGLDAVDPDAQIIVSGYRGYELLYLADAPLRGRLNHTISFYLDEAKKRLPGARLYIAVPPPGGVNRWEDIRIKFPALYNSGTDFTIFKRYLQQDRNGWRLWEVVRTDTD